ncbi:hypothetical protein ACFSAV_08670 [Pasteurella oralis]|uniref:Uncharacterized protein n=1 Tax=Pasteurella oralis TaxID=1071947 RepID=A0ABW4NWL9_9PAST|nr:hypothetical protein [Pasteurella oralis]
MSGFIDLTLISGNKVTVSKTAIFYMEENTNSSNTVLLHCDGVTHEVNESYESLKGKLSNFVQTTSNSGAKIGIHDYNVSYLQEKPNGVQMYGITVYFVGGTVGLPVRENYSDFIKKFHAI